MNKMKEKIQASPLFPPAKSGQTLKGKLTLNNLQTKLATNTPLRGQGVNEPSIAESFI
jgi:hypothetical protein